MQTLVEAATHIAQEIERTRQHLSNLEQALEGLKPLITVDAATTTLTFAMPEPMQPVEDLSVVNVEAPAKRKRKSKAAVQAQPEQIRTAKVKAGKAKAVEAAQVPLETVKLPSTGAEFWLKCIGGKKVTFAQIVQAAVKKLKLDDSAKKVMSARAKTWVHTAVKKGTLMEAGSRDGSKLFQLATANKQSAVEDVPVAEPVEATPLVEAV